RDRLAREAVGIAAAVEALVVVTDRERAGGEELERRDDLGTDERVLPHQRPLCVVELAALAQHRLGHADLPDVVQEPGLAAGPRLVRRGTARGAPAPPR